MVARAEGVTAIAGTEFGSTSSYLRLSYAAVGAAEIPEGIARLGRAARDELEKAALNTPSTVALSSTASTDLPRPALRPSASSPQKQLRPTRAPCSVQPET